MANKYIIDLTAVEHEELCCLIGIGRSLATPPSHTTRHTGPYHGGSIW
jgi:hypothetical protein